MRWLHVGLASVSLLAAACIETAPDHVVLSPAGEQIELMNEPPNPAVYKSLGEVRGEGMGQSTEAAQAARNELRNQAAAKGARLVAVDGMTARVARDLSGRTVVTVTGHAYKPKD